MTALWYATRGTGVVALLLLTGTVLLGLLGPLRTASPRWPRFVVGGLHRNLSLLAVAFVGAHVATSVLDTYAGIGWWDAIVPFGSVYRPFWLGLGAVAFDLLLAVIVTSLLRGRIRYRWWRAVHWLSYACWPLAIVHAWGTGTDAGGGWVLASTLGCLAAVAALAVTRAVVAPKRRLP
ncbi:ferric reductase-like transmembrane domain-containing protein [Actinocatenispora comari]|jgi:DMSO/TMAO reductase YedYZ heme-binding membrane subunit|uniref:Ferric reductase n=1 Tax=Actinocatenispora comari TaxID=2807577 RepID=A0A8J4AE02_9ACTN|nr:ferric reductase-like transmembrane domain-containing protein [Actinocatenispora comari]GIL27927.1 ferric reductase [Actinocatenispora comari]